MELVQDYDSDDDVQVAPTAVGPLDGCHEQFTSHEKSSKGPNDDRKRKWESIELSRLAPGEGILPNASSCSTEPLEGNAQAQLATGTHQGRLRSFPHQEGNYATHVYISGPVDEWHDASAVTVPSSLRETLHVTLAALKRKEPLLQPVEALAALSTKETLVQSSYHISLSRVVPIRYHEIEPLMLSIKEVLGPTERTDLGFGELEILENDDHTRTFLSLGIGKGRQEVCKAIGRLDRAFRDHGLKQFHSQPRPHASVLWMLGSMTDRLQALLREEVPLGQALETLKQWTFPLETISCKVGQRVTTVWCKELPRSGRT